MRVLERSGSALLVFLLTPVAAPILRGQEVLSLEDAVARALRNHPRLAVEAARIGATQGLELQAGFRPNPRLTIQSENWTFAAPPNQPVVSTFTDQFLYATQTLETAGKRQRRVDVAAAAVGVAQEDREVTLRHIAARVKLAYWAAAGAQRVVSLLRENQQNLQQAVDYHEIQVREGAIAEADLVRVRLEYDRGAVALEDAARHALAARIALQQEMGETEFPEVQLTDPLESFDPLPAIDIEAALAARADLQRLRRMVQQAQANLRLQQAVARPDLEILAGYKRTLGVNTALWGLQFNLPFSNRNQGNIAAATGDIRAAEANVAVLEAQIRAEIAAAQRDVETRRLRIASLLATSLARANQSVEIARAAYREGGTDLLRLLDAERTHIELEVLNVRMLTEYRQSLVTLETALGVQP
jgi:cobalt-zinc-cadmium efflux system outer membrane protein